MKPIKQVNFYSLTKDERQTLSAQIHQYLIEDLENSYVAKLTTYFSDDDTYIRKVAYICIGRIFFQNPDLQEKIIKSLDQLFQEDDFKIRQTVINAAGEIGIKNFDTAEPFMRKGLRDEHHAVRNAVIGSIKKMSEKNPVPVLNFAKQFLHHPDKEIRREICHGIELRGRTHPQDILPLLKELQFDSTARVRNTLIHVLGQIAYKKGCLVTVIAEIKNWENKNLVEKALAEIIDVHDRYKDFSSMTQSDAIEYINKNL